MSQGKNKSALEMQFLMNLPSLFKRVTQAANLIKAGSTGAEKKNLAIGLFTDIVATAAPAAATNNPKWAEIIGGVTDAYVQAQNVSGTMPEVETPTLGAVPAATHQ